MTKLVLHKVLVLTAALAVGSVCIANDALAKGGGGGGGHFSGGGGAFAGGGYSGGRGHIGGDIGQGRYAGNFGHGFRHDHARFFAGGYGLSPYYGYGDYGYGYGDCWQRARVRVGGHWRTRQVYVCD